MTEKHQWEADAEEAGYREAVLDVYCLLTANPQILDVRMDRFTLLQAMIKQVNAHENSRLKEVEVEQVS